MDTVSVIYMKCQFCTAKNHCESCSEELAAALAGKPGVQSARVNIPDKKVFLEHSLDPDDLEDTLDEMGLLLG